MSDATILLESLHLALREMRRHRVRSALTMLGVIIGVAALIIVVSISEGARQTIQGQIANLGTNMIIVLPGSTSQGGVRAGAGSAATLTLDDAAAIARECSAVSAAAPVARSVEQAVSELANWSVRITGATADYLDIRSWPLQAGRGLESRHDDAAAKVCVLGRSTADQLFGEASDPVGQRLRIKGTPLEVLGVLAEKGQSPLGEDQDDTVIMPLATFLRHISGGDRPNAIVVSAVSEDAIELATAQIADLLRQRHGLRPEELSDFSVRSVAEAAKTAETTSNVMTALLVCVAGVSLLVGGIGIMNIMLVTVMERTREIGIRLAIGATRRMIRQQFIIEAGTLAGCGGVLGIVLGLLGSYVVARLTGWAGVVSPALLVVPPVFAVGVGVLFGWLPARRASGLNPVESLRHD